MCAKKKKKKKNILKKVQIFPKGNETVFCIISNQKFNILCYFIIIYILL